MTRPLLKLIAFAAVTLLLTGLLARTLGAFAFDGGPAYRARFTDVTGLLVGDDVRVAGVKVGRVTGIDLVQEGGKPTAEVSFTAEDVPLATTVLAKIRYRNLVGQRYLALSEGPGGGDRLKPEGLIPLTQTTPALDLTVVFNGFRPLFTGLSPADVNKFAFEIIQVLQGEGGTLSDLLRRTASLTNTLADRDAAIGRVITNLNAVLGTLDQRDAKLSETIRQMQLLVSGLAADRKAIGGALTNISGLAEATTSLLRDARPSLAADISALNTLAGTLVENSSVIESTLTRAPARLDALTRTASYGSWFNFYLCDFDGRVTFGNTTMNPATFSGTAAKCGGN
ncbi:MAG: MCE family protein [Hamadaea sp.]|uniref:MCE family protein n=1 Tax=Hamadaea sp. TaxID=2024425 RepID=UPI0017D849A4|nr:MlaD family protein [Hamadaea sp.]NUR69886.1 MCE family protein [Hamadaea sp.]NUT22082.1 MCE family protein [Hamadaea sp.]